MNTVIPRIRLISHDSTLMVRLTGLLIYAGFDVSASFDPEDALAYIAHVHPAVVLCDHQIPGFESMDLLGRIKAISPESRIILLSNRSDWACYEEVLRSRGDAVCPRHPLQPLALLRALELALSRKEGAIR
jgi:DNA-binding NarL/FixJ family response regulator